MGMRPIILKQRMPTFEIRHFHFQNRFRNEFVLIHGKNQNFPGNFDWKRGYLTFPEIDCKKWYVFVCVSIQIPHPVARYP